MQDYLQLWCCGVNTDSLGREQQPHVCDVCGFKSAGFVFKGLGPGRGGMMGQLST